MKKTTLELSENGWEYTGTVELISKEIPKKVDDTTIEVDGVTIIFDEDINILCTNPLN